MRAVLETYTFYRFLVSDRSLRGSDVPSQPRYVIPDTRMCRRLLSVVSRTSLLPGAPAACLGLSQGLSEALGTPRPAGEKLCACSTGAGTHLPSAPECEAERNLSRSA